MLDDLRLGHTVHSGDLSLGLAFLAGLFGDSVRLNLYGVGLTLGDLHLRVRLDLLHVGVGLGADLGFLLVGFRLGDDDLLFLRGCKVGLLLSDDLHKAFLSGDLLHPDRGLQLARHFGVGVGFVGLGLVAGLLQVVVTLFLGNGQLGSQLGLGGVLFGSCHLLSDLLIHNRFFVLGLSSLFFHVKSGEVVIVAVVVGNILNVQGDQLHAHVLHFIGHGVAHLLGEFRLVSQHGLGGHGGHDVADRAGEGELHVVDDAVLAPLLKGYDRLFQSGHVVGLGADLRRPVGHDRDRGDGSDLVLVRLHGQHAQIEVRSFPEDRDHEGAAGYDDLGLLAAGDDQRFVDVRHPVDAAQENDNCDDDCGCDADGDQELHCDSSLIKYAGSSALTTRQVIFFCGRFHAPSRRVGMIITQVHVIVNRDLVKFCKKFFCPAAA